MYMCHIAVTAESLTSVKPCKYLDSMIAAVADENIKGAWWLMLSINMAPGPLLQARQPLHTVKSSHACTIKSCLV